MSQMIPQKSHYEYDIYLPVTDGVPEEEFRIIKKEVTEFFGGLTDTRHRNEGLWKADGTTHQDEIVVWKVLSDKETEGDNYLKEIKRRLEILLCQEKILIVRRAVFVLD